LTHPAVYTFLQWFAQRLNTEPGISPKDGLSYIRTNEMIRSELFEFQQSIWV